MKPLITRTLSRQDRNRRLTCKAYQLQCGALLEKYTLAETKQIVNRLKAERKKVKTND